MLFPSEGDRNIASSEGRVRPQWGTHLCSKWANLALGALGLLFSDCSCARTRYLGNPGRLLRLGDFLQYVIHRAPPH